MAPKTSKSDTYWWFRRHQLNSIVIRRICHSTGIWLPECIDVRDDFDEFREESIVIKHWSCRFLNSYRHWISIEIWYVSTFVRVTKNHRWSICKFFGFVTQKIIITLKIFISFQRLKPIGFWWIWCHFEDLLKRFNMVLKS